MVYTLFHLHLASSQDFTKFILLHTTTLSKLLKLYSAKNYSRSLALIEKLAEIAYIFECKKKTASILSESSSR